MHDRVAASLADDQVCPLYDHDGDEERGVAGVLEGFAVAVGLSIKFQCCTGYISKSFLQMLTYNPDCTLGPLIVKYSSFLSSTYLKLSKSKKIEIFIINTRCMDVRPGHRHRKTERHLKFGARGKWRNIIWKEKVTNEEVLQRVLKDRNL